MSELCGLLDKDVHVQLILNIFCTICNESIRDNIVYFLAELH